MGIQLNNPESFMVAAYKTMQKYGATIDKTDDQPDVFTMYISVPEHSVNKTTNGEELAGAKLARNIKDILQPFGQKKLVMKYRIRKGETWTTRC